MATKRKAKEANVYGSGLPKGRRLKSASKDDRGGLCTVPPPPKTTDDLVSLIRGELRDLLEVIEQLATPLELAPTGANRTRREELIGALAFDAAQWCESIANALETGRWPELKIESQEDALRIWAETAEAIGEACEDDYEGALLAFCVRGVRKALPPKTEAA